MNVKWFLVSHLLYLGLGLGNPLAGQEFNDEFDDSAELGLYKYQSNPDRVRLKSTVHESTMARFRQGDPIAVRISQKSPQMISSLIIEKPGSFNSRPVPVAAETRIKGNDVVIEVSQSMLDRLEYQPLEIRVFQSNVQQLLLVPTINDRETTAPAFAPQDNSKFFLRLTLNNGVTVSLDPRTPFELTDDSHKMELLFGEIEAIFFNHGSESLASVVLRNGDNFTGKHNWPPIVRMATEWGPAEIQLKRIASISRERGVSLVLSGLENPRWMLLKSE